MSCRSSGNTLDNHRDYNEKVYIMYYRTNNVIHGFLVDSSQHP